jgi:tRNA/tmRNA/rRNA uracil-C5-methylase (TrmA/RlmC/RlmD family)
MNYRNSATLSYNNINNFKILSPYIIQIYTSLIIYKNTIDNITIRHSNSSSLIQIHSKYPIHFDLDLILNIDEIELKSLYWNDKLIYGDQYIWYDFTINNKIYQSVITSTNFFQINRFLFTDLYNRIIEEFSPYSIYNLIGFGDDTPNVLLPIIDQYKINSLIGFVHHSSNIENFERNISQNKLKCQFKIYLEKDYDNNLLPLSDNILICNPGRKGLPNEICEKINKSNIKIIFYMSCKPKTLEHNLKILSNYKLIKKYQFDFFPFIDNNDYLETLNILTI